jgi:hypothetical protein
MIVEKQRLWLSNPPVKRHLGGNDASIGIDLELVQQVHVCIRDGILDPDNQAG